jgi:hypothetical protein
MYIIHHDHIDRCRHRIKLQPKLFLQLRRQCLRCSWAPESEVVRTGKSGLSKHGSAHISRYLLREFLLTDVGSDEDIIIRPYIRTRMMPSRASSEQKPVLPP